MTRPRPKAPVRREATGDAPQAPRHAAQADASASGTPVRLLARILAGRA